MDRIKAQSKKKLFTGLILGLFWATGVFAMSKNIVDVEPEIELEPLTDVLVKESWGFVSMQNADEYSDDMPLTDVCYFACDVNCYGELVDVPSINKLKVTGKRRHLVFVCDSKSLTHFVLDPQYKIRDKILKQLVKAASPYDGINVDLELIPARDGKFYMEFLRELRKAMGPDKMLSVCVAARMRLLTDDVFPYAEISKVADRIFVMAYDEHWSTSKPGPIASVDWCRRITDYAASVIPQEKLIMGIPFYGRCWQDSNHSRAWYNSSMNRIIDENNIKKVEYADGIPTITYTATVNVTGFFNDQRSFHSLAQMYLGQGVNKIGYWRIGQEDPKVWELVKIEGREKPDEDIALDETLVASVSSN